MQLLPPQISGSSIRSANLAPDFWIDACAYRVFTVFWSVVFLVFFFCFLLSTREANLLLTGSLTVPSESQSLVSSLRTSSSSVLEHFFEAAVCERSPTSLGMSSHLRARWIPIHSFHLFSSYEMFYPG